MTTHVDPVMIGDGPCPQCGHPFDPHILVTMSEDPLEGGFIVCPVEDCDCMGSWDLKADADIQAFWRMFRGGEGDVAD
jgi:hypothetical protein